MTNSIDSSMKGLTETAREYLNKRGKKVIKRILYQEITDNFKTCNLDTLEKIEKSKKEIENTGEKEENGQTITQKKKEIIEKNIESSVAPIHFVLPISGEIIKETSSIIIYSEINPEPEKRHIIPNFLYGSPEKKVLKVYPLYTGGIVKEFIQDSIYFDKQHHYYLALEDEQGEPIKETLWKR